ncbi:hypothetical protein ACFLX4_02835 [Chloroflexota bacterium]
MGKLNEIKQKLSDGSTTKQLIDQGYAKSSVFNVARKLANTKSDIHASSVPDEVQDLRHQREIIKLQKEIAELEVAKEKLPQRVDNLEHTVLKLRSLLYNAVDTALLVSLEYAGMDREKAKEYADGWVEKNIKG